jgi:methionyl aminopeptidase
VSREDGWTIVTVDGKPAAHYEHSIAISPNGAPADLMSDHRPIEEAIRNNPNLRVVDNLDEELVERYQPLAVV